MSIQKLKWAAIISFVCFPVGSSLAEDISPKTGSPLPGKSSGYRGEGSFSKRSDIMAGQDVYQRYGLMDHGSVWGHGSQRGMEFSAMTLHLLGDRCGKILSQQEHGKTFEDSGAAAEGDHRP